MKIAIEYNYPIVYIPYRHLNRQSRLAAASTVVEIKEIDPSEAPVVLRIGINATKDKGRKFAFKEDGSLREIRQFNGQLYIEDSPSDLLQASVETDINKSPLGFSYLEVDQNRNQQLWTKDQIIRSQTNPLRSIDDDGGEKIAKLLQTRADKLLIVNGMIFKICREPVLAINVDEAKAKINEAPHDRYGNGLDTIDFIGYKLTTNLVEAEVLLPSLSESIDIDGEWEIVDPLFASFDGTSFDIGRQYKEIEYILSSNVDKLQRNALDLYFAFRDGERPDLTMVTSKMLELSAEAKSIELNEVELSNAINSIRTNQSSIYETGFIEHMIKLRAGLNHQEIIDQIKGAAKEIAFRWDMRPHNWIDEKWNQVREIEAGVDSVAPEYC